MRRGGVVAEVLPRDAQVAVYALRLKENPVIGLITEVLLSYLAQWLAP